MKPTTLKDTSLNKDVTKPRNKKRVLDFKDLKDPELVEKTEQQVKKLANEVEGQPLISLKQWCGERSINPSLMVRLFNEAEFPIIRIGEFQGVYELHLSRILEKESKRQVEQQVKNRVCARILTLRQHQEKRNAR